MTIFQIECFLAVAEHLNFARAATQLNVSQPAITRQIHTLEAELGTQLLSAVQEWYDSRKMDVFSSQMPSL